MTSKTPYGINSGAVKTQIPAYLPVDNRKYPYKYLTIIHLCVIVGLYSNGEHYRMTTKVSNLMRPNGVPKYPRLIIELLPDGNSRMTADGPLNQIAIALMLCSQLNTLLPNMFREVFKAASGIVNPRTGLPEIPNTFEVKTEDVPEEGPDDQTS